MSSALLPHTAAKADFGAVLAADAELAALTVPLRPVEPSSGTFLHPPTPAEAAINKHATTEPRRPSADALTFRRAEKIFVGIYCTRECRRRHAARSRLGVRGHFETVCF
jgi:hypothetical protein